MKIRSITPAGSRSGPAPRIIALPERALAQEGEPRDGVSAQARFWARTSNYTWVMGVVAVGLGLQFYYMREMLASLALFSLVFFTLSLVALSVFSICYAGNQAAIWAGPASRAVIAIFQHQDRGGTELVRVPVVEEERRLPDHRSEI
jgi:hypothetical protein